MKTQPIKQNATARFITKGQRAGLFPCTWGTKGRQVARGMQTYVAVPDPASIRRAQPSSSHATCVASLAAGIPVALRAGRT